MADDTLIAGTKTVGDWKKLKQELVSAPSTELWQKAYDEFFLERLKTRYFEPIEAISKIRSHTGKGFAIMTILCSLLEFLEATIRGRKYVRKNKQDCGPDEYADSGEMFRAFLLNRVPFAAEFQSNPALAEDFYKDVRCGLLHEARTKRDWRINIAQSSGRAAIDEQERIIYWDNVRNSVDRFLEGYKTELLNNKVWQDALIRKFDGLCD